MNFLIGKLSKEQLANTDPEGLFSLGKDKFFYNLEFMEDDMIRITDSIGRTMPMDIDEVSEFAEIFRRITQYQEDKEFYKQKLFMELIEGGQY